MKINANNYAFIDSQNLNLGVRGLGWKLDWRKLRIYLKEKYQVNKAYLFIGYISENRKMYEFLNSIGYELVYKPVVKNKIQEVKGNIDAELVLQAAAIDYSNYQQAIIVTGDGDFYCLVKFLLRNNKLKRLLVPNKLKYSVLLRRAVGPIGYMSFFNDLRKLLEYKTPPVKAE